MYSPKIEQRVDDGVEFHTLFVGDAKVATVIADGKQPPLMHFHIIGPFRNKQAQAWVRGLMELSVVMDLLELKHGKK